MRACSAKQRQCCATCASVFCKGCALRIGEQGQGRTRARGGHGGRARVAGGGTRQGVCTGVESLCCAGCAAGVCVWLVCVCAWRPEREHAVVARTCGAWESVGVCGGGRAPCFGDGTRAQVFFGPALGPKRRCGGAGRYFPKSAGVAGMYFSPTHPHKEHQRAAARALERAVCECVGHPLPPTRALRRHTAGALWGRLADGTVGCVACALWCTLVRSLQTPPHH